MMNNTGLHLKKFFSVVRGFTTDSYEFECPESESGIGFSRLALFFFYSTFNILAYIRQFMEVKYGYNFDLIYFSSNYY